MNEMCIHTSFPKISICGFGGALGVLWGGNTFYFAKCHHDLIRMEILDWCWKVGGRSGTWVLGVEGFFTPAGSGERWFASAARSTLFSHSSPNARSCSNPSWKWQTYDTVWPDPVGGRVEFPMGADASKKVLSFKPGVFSWLSHVSDKWITISGLHTISAVISSKFYCFYCEYFSFDSIETMVDLDSGRNHSHKNKE